MTIEIVRVIYLILFFTFVSFSFFIILNIIRYSFSKTVTIAALAIFVPVVSTLLATNLVLFNFINWNYIFSLFSY